MTTTTTTTFGCDWILLSFVCVCILLFCIVCILEIHCRVRSCDRLVDRWLLWTNATVNNNHISIIPFMVCIFLIFVLVCLSVTVTVWYLSLAFSEIQVYLQEFFASHNKLLFDLLRVEQYSEWLHWCRNAFSRKARASVVTVGFGCTHADGLVI